MKLKITKLYLLIALLSNFIGPALNAGLTSDYYQTLNSQQKKYWSYLLHLNESGVSKIDSDKFFIDPKGKYDSDLEFNATVEALKNEELKAGWYDYPIQCVFRERFEFIKSLGLLNGIKINSCEMFEEWKKSLNVESLSLVFSSSYPNNPSSMFGHTLIRLNQKNKTNDLLDYSVSFSAIPDNSDLGIIYAYKGMFGGYKGFIEITKYYTKVSDYINSESRDLLEYELKLNSNDVERFINHVWEIYQTSFADYYFFDENCSSFLAELLQIAFGTEVDISKHQRWHYLPAEIVKSIKKADKIRDFHFRPSLKKVFNAKLENLSKEDKKLVIDYIFFNETEVELPANALDTLITYYNYKKNKKKLVLSESDNLKLRKLLVKSSKVNFENIKESNVNEIYRPENGHEPFGLILFHSYSDNFKNSTGIHFKNGYHNILDQDFGHDKFSQFDFLEGKFSYNYKNKKVFIDQLKVVDLISTHPFSIFDPQFSWNALFLLDSKEHEDFLKHFMKLKMNMGPSFRLFDQFLMSFYIGGQIKLYFSNLKEREIGPNLENNFMFSFARNFKLIFSQEVNFDFAKSFKKDVSYSYRVRGAYNLELNKLLKLEFNSEKKTGMLGYEIHF